MGNCDALVTGREALRRHAWGHVYDALSDADQQARLDAADLEHLAIAAYLIGKDADSVNALARAHQAHLGIGASIGAARCAFWAAFVLLNKGEPAQASGWLARARRLLDDGQHDCVERGYLLLPAALEFVAEGDIETAHATFAEAARIGERFDDTDLVSLARQGSGRALIGLGDVTRGVALLDEVMVAVTAGEVSPHVAGTVYCSVIDACFEIFDMRRAQEWTGALHRWCASEPDLIPYRGHCQVRRAEIMLLQGVWPDALEEAQRACERLGQAPRHRAAGAAFYQLAEVHRLRGEFAKAEDAYRLAGESGRTPHPGLALLRLAQGRIEAAKAGICRVVDEARDRRTRSRVLGPYVDILLASGDAGAARTAADELSGIAAAVNTPFLRAVSAQTNGAVLLAEGQAKRALASLREACTFWRELEAPYEAARVSVLIGLACRALGDDDGARMEWRAARQTFHGLGAAPDVARVDPLCGAAGTGAHVLTAREMQVLRLIATGKTNGAIASELAISEKTVARHVSNIFVKLDLSTRAAATAYAFQHHVV